LLECLQSPKSCRNQEISGVKTNDAESNFFIGKQVFEEAPSLERLKTSKHEPMVSSMEEDLGPHGSLDLEDITDIT
jgi:hypothetical protein